MSEEESRDPRQEQQPQRRRQNLREWFTSRIRPAAEGGGTQESERTGGGALERFTKAAEAYGATGMHYERLEGGSEVLSQKLGEGWHGLGYDTKDKSVWMGLTAQGERYDWNANTVLRGGEQGIVAGEHGMLSADHPLSQLYSGLKDREGVEVHITGFHAGWGRSEQTRLTPDEEGNLLGNIPQGSEVKAVITNTEAEWFDGGPVGDAWKGGQEQRLTIKPAASNEMA